MRKLMKKKVLLVIAILFIFLVIWLFNLSGKSIGHVGKNNAHLGVPYRRVNAVILIFASSTDLNDLRKTLIQFEAMFNANFKYPYVLLGDQPFDSYFKETVRKSISNGSVEFGHVAKAEWSYPPWINKEHADAVREEMTNDGIEFGGSEAFRHKARYMSGFFYLHQLLQNYDYFWRISPGSQFHCPITYDLFAFMFDKEIEYGFSLIDREWTETGPSLWESAKAYISQQQSDKAVTPQPLIPNSPVLDLFLDRNEKSIERDYYGDFVPEYKDAELFDKLDYKSWTGCQFQTNFEIAKFSLFRNSQYQRFFNRLDGVGGFYYERWSDASVHSLAVGMLLDKMQIHHFRDIGYSYGKDLWCPHERAKSCTCDVGSGHNMANGGDLTFCLTTVIERLEKEKQKFKNDHQ